MRQLDIRLTVHLALSRRLAQVSLGQPRTIIVACVMATCEDHLCQGTRQMIKKTTARVEGVKRLS